MYKKFIMLDIFSIVILDFKDLLSFVLVKTLKFIQSFALSTSSTCCYGLYDSLGSLMFMLMTNVFL